MAKQVKCLVNGIVIVHGIVSRNKYIFTEQNNILSVEDDDLPDILSKKWVTGGCCGSPKKETQLFTLVE